MAYLVGIVGGSASGKTSFLRELYAHLPAGMCSIVSQDNYYRPLAEQQNDEHGRTNFDLPTALERERFYEDVCTLRRGESVTRTEYTFNQRQGALLTIAPAEILLLEGLFLFHYEEIRTLLDLRVYVEASEAVCRARRHARDQRERDYTSAEIEHQWTYHVLPAFQRYILPYRQEAHVIVVNDENYERGLEEVVWKIKQRNEAPSA